jgi:hypothetical protein
MKQKGDEFTLDMLDRKRRRPRKLHAKTGAQRQREFRQRNSQKISVTCNENSCSSCGARCNSCGLCNVGQLGRIAAN